MRDSLALTTPISALPLIDVGALRSPKPTAQAAMTEAIRAACLSKGFFYIANHGIAPSLIDAVLRESRNFFSLPLTERLRVRRECSICNRGYEPMGGQDLERTGTPDLKEAFYLGVDLPEDDPRVLARKAGHGPNQWPCGLPAFRGAMEAYFAAMLDLSVRLMGAVAQSLDLPEDYFAGFCTEPVALLRLLHYPPQPANGAPDEKGCGAHTDWGAITLLLQDDAGGLQIRDPVHGWLHAPPIPGAFVVNIGDLIARWTNDLYQSTEHRVINLSGRDRFSVPFFFDGNPDYVVSCLPGCSGPGDPPRYRPTTVAEHVEAMHRATFVADAPGAMHA
jgi:isopenicillin N synthase-like dioxygenase